MPRSRSISHRTRSAPRNPRKIGSNPKRVSFTRRSLHEPPTGGFSFGGTVPVPASIDDLSTTASSNSPGGSETPTEGDNYLRTHASFIAALRDKLNGTSDTGTIKNPTLSGTADVSGATWSGHSKLSAKTASTTRSSTSTLADDPHLSVSLTAGTYAVDAYFHFWGSASSTQGFKAGVSYTGTVTGSSAAIVGNNGGATITSSAGAISSAFNTVNNISANVAFADHFHFRGYMTVSDSGTATVQWSQVNSSASSTTLGIGSWIKFTRI